MVTEHIRDAQFLDSNDAETVDDAPCVLMAEVMTTITNALMDTRDDFASLSAFLAPALLFREFALCFGKSLFIFAEKARASEELAIGKSRESLQPNVNADGFLGRRQVFGFNFLAKAGEPLAIDAPNRTSLEFAPRSAVEFGFHLSDFGKADGAVTDTKTVVLRESNAVILAFAFETREPRSVTRLHAVKERLERKVYAVNDILQYLTVNGFESRMVFLPRR